MIKQVGLPPRFKLVISNLNFSDRVGNLLIGGGKRISRSILDVFHGIFCETHFSWRCWRRSCLVSLLSVAICLLIMLSVVGIESLTSLYQHSLSNFGERIKEGGFRFSETEYFLWVLTIPFIMNLLADYLALYKTRLLLGWLQKQKKVWVAGSAFIVDQIGTYMCFFFGVLLATCVVGVLLLGVAVVGKSINEWDGLIRVVGGHVLHLLAAMNQPLVMVPCVVSTFFSSCWLWLFGLSMIIQRLQEFGLWYSRRMKISSVS